MFTPAGQELERGWPGRIDGDTVVQLAAQTLQSFFTGGSAAREHAEYRLDDVLLRAPVLEPPAVRVFEDASSFSFANPNAIRSPGALIARPAGRLDVTTRLRRGDRPRRCDRRLDRAGRMARAGAGAAQGSRLRAPARAGRRHRARGRLRLGGCARARGAEHPAAPGRPARRPAARAARGRRERARSSSRSTASARSPRTSRTRAFAGSGGILGPCLSTSVSATFRASATSSSATTAPCSPKR